MQFNTIPTNTVSLTDKNVIQRVWYFFWQGLYRGVPPASESSVTPGLSPFTYTATVKGELIVQGGTVSMIQRSRTLGTNYNLGVTQGPISLNAGDSAVITYSVAPTLTFFPR